MTNISKKNSKSKTKETLKLNSVKSEDVTVPVKVEEPVTADDPVITEKPIEKSQNKTKKEGRQYINPTGSHSVLAEASVGLQHRNIKPYALPCQDAASVTAKPRPILVLCDGAGSASMSELGSSALVVQISRLCQSLEPVLPAYLDIADTGSDHQALVRIIIRHAMGVLQDLSTIHRRDMRDFRSTLNFALVGTEHTLWVRVGDGEIVQEKISYLSSQPQQLKSELSCLGEQAKGEYANQTQFIDNDLSFEDVHWGLLSSHAITGLALMSDGASEKLVANARDKVSGQITDWLELLRKEKLKPSDVCKRFYSDEFNHQSTGDDRSIALWIRQFQ